MDVNYLTQNENLRPYFLDLISKHLLWNMSDSFGVRHAEKIKIQKDYYDSLYNLSLKLKEHVPEDKLLSIIDEVSDYYIKNGLQEFAI